MRSSRKLSKWRKARQTSDRWRKRVAYTVEETMLQWEAVGVLCNASSFLSSVSRHHHHHHHHHHQSFLAPHVWFSENNLMLFPVRCGHLALNFPLHRFAEPLAKSHQTPVGRFFYIKSDISSLCFWNYLFLATSGFQLGVF